VLTPPAASSRPPLGLRQGSQLTAKILKPVRPNGLPRSPKHSETHRAIKRRQISFLEPAGLALLESQADDSPAGSTS